MTIHLANVTQFCNKVATIAPPIPFDQPCLVALHFLYVYRNKL